MVSFLIDPFSLSFMQRGLVGGILIGMTCAVLGAFVVWRGMAFIGDAMAHTVLPGIVIAFLNGASLFVGALIAGIVTAVGIGWFSKDGQVREDSAIGIMFSGLFALGIALLSRVNSYQDLSHILFGNVLGVSWGDIAAITVVLIIVGAGVALFYKELVVTSFDPGHARAIGLSPATVRYGLLILLALAVVSGIQAVGVVMVVSLLVTPAATASLLTKRLDQVIVLGAGLSVLGTVTGLLASFHLDIATGPVIVLTLTGFFILTFLFAPKQGWLMRLMDGDLPRRAN
ncbi:MAG: metal ABC transporter permease [Chloroflexi bacterium]|nr:metal ABC transporter permease [Chloroflexota bacterium]